MPIPIICSCSAKLRVADHLLGKHIQCPKCDAFHAVGGTADAEETAGGRPAGPPPVAVVEGALPEAERERLEGALADGEELIWADKPDLRGAFLRGFVVSGFFGVTGAVLLVAAIVLAVLGRFGSAAVFLVPALALFAVAGSAPSWSRWRAGQTVYAFTDKRALAWECDLLGRVSLRPYTPAEVAGVTLKYVGANGVADLEFGMSIRRDKRGQVRGFKRLAFSHVRNATAVERLMRERLIDPFVDKINA